MKKFAFILFGGLLFLAQEAYAVAAEAVFTSSAHDKILVILNHQPLNLSPSRNVFVQGRPGMHKVQIRVYNRWGRLKLVHHDRIHLRPGSHQQFILETHPFRGSRLVAYRKHALPPSRHLPERRAPVPPPAPRLGLMEDFEFRRLMNVLERPGPESKKVAIAKRALRNRYVYSEDVKEIMQTFNFERNKLTIAKYAYSRVTDPEHFEVVYDDLRYEPSLTELEDFLYNQ